MANGAYSADQQICKLLYNINVAKLGLAEMQMYPETVPTLVWTSLHVMMNMLFFLIVRGVAGCTVLTGRNSTLNSGIARFVH